MAPFIKCYGQIRCTVRTCHYPEAAGSLVVLNVHWPGGLEYNEVEQE